MKAPKPRVTQIIKSGKIKELFYEGFFEEETPNNDDLIIALHYQGQRFDLFEFIQIKPGVECDFEKIEGQPLLGRITAIEPDSEGEENLILRIDDCESDRQDLFLVTEIEKEKS